MNLFDPKNKVVTRTEGTMYRWKEWTIGAQFGGTFLGSHQWESGEGKLVTAYDFADCTIDGEKKPENEIFCFNQSYILDEIMEKVKPGQRIGIEYAGQAKGKNGKQGVRLFTPFIDPNNIDTDYQRFLRAVPTASKAVDVEEAEETAPEAPKAAAAQPFYTLKDIMAIAAGKLGVTDEAGAKVTVKAITGLEVVEANYEEIMKKLTAQFGA